MHAPSHVHMHTCIRITLLPLPTFHQSVFPPQQNCFVSQFTEKAFSKTEDIEHSLVLLLHLFTLVIKIVQLWAGDPVIINCSSAVQSRQTLKQKCHSYWSQYWNRMDVATILLFGFDIFLSSLFLFIVDIFACLPLLHHRASRNYISLWMYVYVSVLEIIRILLSQTARVHIP